MTTTYIAAMISNLLTKLGFSGNEIKVYTAILKARRITPAQISKLTAINRTTVYAIAKGLTSKGLVVEDLGYKTRALLPVNANGLEKIIQTEKQALGQKEKLIQQVVEKLEFQGIRTEYAPPKIRFVEGGDLLDHLYKRKKIWDKSAMEYDRHCWGFPDHTLVEQYWEWIEWFWKKAPQALQLKLLSNESKIEKMMFSPAARLSGYLESSIDNRFT